MSLVATQRSMAVFEWQAMSCLKEVFERQILSTHDAPTMYRILNERMLPLKYRCKVRGAAAVLWLDGRSKLGEFFC